MTVGEVAEKIIERLRKNHPQFLIPSSGVIRALGNPSRQIVLDSCHESLLEEAILGICTAVVEGDTHENRLKRLALQLSLATFINSCCVSPCGCSKKPEPTPAPEHI